ncbi:hypothetical protein A3D71_04530 [Candidatus Kaiserbacteria bacterium RIFCSPHIGHO2_02_FULL_55_20]|uniref:Lycopene cyclase domain-containing protein n=1 Tax=Candidatus Kaiserbacteria bacterium RIFCSPHIGHO2_02_FULL_55_20 TaxID=1798497 RepID=A0A1F6DV39_9BACT|nr:MAG: hypothetical protein A2680_04115 [Candidatus Kaiserbacteria bacterium RIFCSPHIGHO2_01_FULL_55_37]OGG65319.1 MAG: hypothetical protein A3D71_04530 [Candidatus Kaiserbacteria bacterium RIFCSPHIGHO2_02_FULL_55_20]
MISVDFSYAYIAFILFFGFVWLSVFLARPDLRKEILFMSFVCAPLGILGDFFYRYDYYNLPNLNGTYWYLYSFALGFIYGGVTAVLYEELVRKHHTTRRIRRMLEHPWCFWGVLLSGSFVMVVGTFILRINSLYVSLLVMAVAGLWIVVHRRDLLIEALGSGAALCAVTYIFYGGFQVAFPGVFESQWNIADLSGVLIANVPLEEYLWAFTWGFLAGPAYEYVVGFRFALGSSVSRRTASGK